MAMEWGEGGEIEQGPRGVLGRQEVQARGDRRGRASGTTTKILFRWDGGYWYTFGCTGKGGRGGGGVVGRQKDGHHKNPPGTKSNERIVRRKRRLGTQRLGMEWPLAKGGTV